MPSSSSPVFILHFASFFASLLCFIFRLHAWLCFMIQKRNGDDGVRTADPWSGNLFCWLLDHATDRFGIYNFRIILNQEILEFIPLGGLRIRILHPQVSKSLNKIKTERTCFGDHLLAEFCFIVSIIHRYCRYSIGIVTTRSKNITDYYWVFRGYGWCCLA